MSVLTILTLGAALLAGCKGGAGGEAGGAPSGDAPPARAEGTHPFLVIGIDAAEWSSVERLWQQGKLPHMKQFCDKGVCGKMVGSYSSSPIIWTTIATGVSAERHGIEGFTVKQDNGNLAPVSSTMRKTKAIWNMLSEKGRKVSVLGWWVSWPAEQVNGAMFSTLAEKTGVPDRVYPKALEEEFDRTAKEAVAAQDLFKLCDQFAPNDAWVGWHGEKFAAQLAKGDYDLVMAYFRCVDVVSHQYWAYWEPEKFKSVDPQQLEKYKDVIPANYEATDAMVGNLLKAAGPNVNTILVSDHGFYAMKQEEVVVRVLMDRVFAMLGFAELEGEEPILSKSKVYTYNSRPKRQRQMVRFALAGREEGGTVKPEEMAGIRTKLAEELAKFRYTTGRSVFKLRDAKEDEVAQGADFVIHVLREDPTTTLIYDGQNYDRFIGVITRQSGNHHEPIPPGMFMAMGPDIDPKASISEFKIEDFTPTLLYGLGLPTAQDLDGKPVASLFTPAFQAAHPLQTVPTWGPRDQASTVSTSSADQDMLDELRQLGYIE